MSAASHLADGRPAVLDTDKVVGDLDFPGIVQDLTNLACLSACDENVGFGEAGRELAKAQLRRRRELEREARQSEREAQHA